jgi:hypothetical protein
VRVVLPVDERWGPEYQRRLNGELERALAKVNEAALVPHGGTAGQVLTKASDRPYDLAWAAATGDTSDFVLKSTTMLGKTGPVGLDAVTNTAAEWSALPVGYSRMMDAATIGTAGGAPINTGYGYFTKIANRDVGGGWGGIWSGYDGGDLYYGWAQVSTDLPTWRKVLYDGIDTVEINNTAGGSVVNDLFIQRSGTPTDAVGRNSWIQLWNSTASKGGGVQAYSGGGLLLWTYVAGWYNPVTVHSAGVNINDGNLINFWNAGSTTAAALQYNDATTYTALQLDGKKNGYAGIMFSDGFNDPALMMADAGNQWGVWDATSGWRFYVNGESIQVANATKCAPIAQWGTNCKMTRGTVAPSGGSDGDIYFRYGASRGLYIHVGGIWELVAS